MTKSEPRRLEGRVVIVTGAGQGIGQNIAMRVATEGAVTILVGRTQEKLNETAAHITNLGGVAEINVVDIAQSREVRDFVERVVMEHGEIHGLVNNAAVFDEPPFLETMPDALVATFETNVFGTYFMSQAVARSMTVNGRGSIVHISSIDAFGADGPVPVYSATKAAVSSLAKTMTLELAPLGVRVNCVAPGFVNTDMVQKTSSPEVLKHMLTEFQRVPLRRLVEPHEVAAAVAFLLSDDASAITGIDLVVDGGLLSNLYVYETLPGAFEL